MSEARRVTALRLSAGEKAVIETAARVNRQTPSEFMRDAIVTAASECLEIPARGKLRPGPLGVMTPSGVKFS